MMKERYKYNATDVNIIFWDQPWRYQHLGQLFQLPIQEVNDTKFEIHLEKSIKMKGKGARNLEPIKKHEPY